MFYFNISHDIEFSLLRGCFRVIHQTARLSTSVNFISTNISSLDIFITKRERERETFIYLVLTK